MRRDLDALAAQVFDIVVVGGGIHGAWIAWRAAREGYRVALIEKHDFGGATSANSLKILHGGLRYLQHLDFGRMRSSIRARREFGRGAPHLVQPLPCLMPLRRGGLRSPWVLGPALLANDVISWDRNSRIAPQSRLPHGRLTGAQRCRSAIAPLADVDPVAGALWWDAAVVDAGRLTLEPVLKAAAAGAVVANHVEAQALLIHNGTIGGVAAADHRSGRALEVRSRLVIDATGPWAGTLSAASGLPTDFLPPGWVGGMNVVLRRSLETDMAIALTSSSRAADRSAVLRRAARELFFVPWRGVTMVGTDYHSVADRTDAVQGPPAGAVARFLDEIAAVAPRAGVTAADVALVHWGLLPLQSAGDAVPRKSPILATQTGVDGLIVVIGEKMTSAPVLSERVLACVERMSSARPRSSSPTRVSVGGPAADPPTDDQSVSKGRAAGGRLAERYGTEWPNVAAHADGRPELLAPIHASCAVLGVEIVHAIREEMALDLDDLVLRRLGLGDTGHPGLDVVRRCAELAALEWQHDATATDRAVAALDARLTQRGWG